MQYGINIRATVPVRETPSDKSQMVNQLLFGDLYYIKETQNKWSLIETAHDKYEGWVDNKQIYGVSERWFKKALQQPVYVVKNLCEKITDPQGREIPVTFGAKLPFFNGNNFFIEDYKYSFSGNASKHPGSTDGAAIINTAETLLGSPYLWGGRSPFGMDCSGFTQIVFGINAIMLPRDASQQVEKGVQVDFIEESKSGDLAFFGNKEGEITHVGIITGNNKIIHASGDVHLDSIDHHGIFNEKTQNYSHTLRVIKRII